MIRGQFIGRVFFLGVGGGLFFVIIFVWQSINIGQCYAILYVCGHTNTNMHIIYCFICKTQWHNICCNFVFAAVIEITYITKLCPRTNLHPENCWILSKDLQGMTECWWKVKSDPHIIWNITKVTITIAWIHYDNT